jgi:hypothetical protein
LENAEILLSYDEPRYDLVLSVPPSPSQGDSLSRHQSSEEASQPPLPHKNGSPL